MDDGRAGVRVEEDAAAPTEAEEQPWTTAQTAAGADPEPEAEPQLSGRPEAAIQPQDGEPQAERKPAPATEAARRAAGWPPIVPEHDPAIESDPPAGGAADGPDQPDGLHAWAAQAAIEPAEPLEREDPCRNGAGAERGAPARLLRAAVRPAPKAVRAHGHGFERRLPRRAESRTPRNRRTRRPADVEGIEVAAEDTVRVEAAGVEGRLDIAAEDPEPTDEALGVDEPVVDAAEPADEADPSGEDEPEQAATDAASPAPASDTDPLAEDRPIAAETPTEPEQELAPTGAADEQAAAPDLSAELKAAEEVAAEQVTAVLTAVLDRLGSAHHRPFSRP